MMPGYKTLFGLSFTRMSHDSNDTYCYSLLFFLRSLSYFSKTEYLMISLDTDLKSFVFHHTHQILHVLVVDVRWLDYVTSKNKADTILTIECSHEANDTKRMNGWWSLMTQKINIHNS